MVLVVVFGVLGLWSEPSGSNGFEGLDRDLWINYYQTSVVLWERAIERFKDC